MNKITQKLGMLITALLLLPTLIYAKGAYDDVSKVNAMNKANICKIEETNIEYADLSDALAAVRNNQTIKLLQNINYTKVI